MADTESNTLTQKRQATLKLSSTDKGHTLVARVPGEISEEEFLRVGRAAYGLVNKLTGCNCMSGRISFVVEDVYSDVIQVNLEHE